MEFKIITDEQGLLAERKEWTGIYHSMKHATPFQSWEWNYAWWKNNEPADSLYIIKAYVANTTYAYAPLVVKRNNAEFIGGRDMDYGRFLVCYKEIEVIKGFISTLLEKGFTITLQEMASQDEQLHIILKILEDQKNVIIHRTTRTVFIDAAKYGDYASYSRCLSKNMRDKIKKGLRNAEKNGIAITKEDVTSQNLQEIEDIYQSRQLIRGGAPDITWSFPVMKAMQEAGLLRLYMVRDEETAIAFMTVLKGKNGYFTWLMAFREGTENSGSGQLLNYQVIVDNFADGFPRLDFMRGDYDFKLRWECELDTNYTVYKLNSRTEFLGKKIYFWLRKIAKRFVYNHSTLKGIYKKYA